MSDQGPSIMTIGHSTRSFEEFVKLLENYGITAVGDVRSMPFSRFNPQFNKAFLQRELPRSGIKYVFLGAELGARSDDQSCYQNGRVSYARLAATNSFKHGISRVVRGSQKYKIVLMCAEKEPLSCHRTLLVARGLDDQGIDVAHILGNGELEWHRETMERLLYKMGLHQELFSSKEDLIAQALIKQEAKVAYVDERLISDTFGDR